jgi:hypothetical protein
MNLAVLFGYREMLCPAVALTNDTGITQENDCDGVEYWHLLFDEHELLDTYGMWSESFFAGPTALSELPRNTALELHRLFPRLNADELGYGRSVLPALTKREGALLKNSATALRARSRQNTTHSKAKLDQPPRKRRQLILTDG